MDETSGDLLVLGESSLSDLQDEKTRGGKEDGGELVKLEEMERRTETRHEP